MALYPNSAVPPKPDLTVRLLSRIVPALRSAFAYFPFPASRLGPFAPEPSRGAGRLGPELHDGDCVMRTLVLRSYPGAKRQNGELGRQSVEHALNDAVTKFVRFFSWTNEPIS